MAGVVGSRTRMLDGKVGEDIWVGKWIGVGRGGEGVDGWIGGGR